MEKYDVIIVGAGAAGLYAAKLLADAKKNICLLEARDRIGGRIHTIKRTGFKIPIEAGAEFIHGKLPITLKLLKEAGIKYHETKGLLWQVKDNQLKERTDFVEHADELFKQLKKLKEYISVSGFLNKYFPDEKYNDMKSSLKQYIQGYDAGDIDDFSSLALKEEWEEEDDQQYRIEGGYGLLLHYLADSIKEHCSLKLFSVVKQVNWRNDHVEIITGDKKLFFAEKVIITVPLPFLYNNGAEAGISFYPPLPEIATAASSIGYGGVIKIILEFDHPFWDTDKLEKAKNLSFIFSDKMVPTWWTQLPDKTARLTGWLAGPNASKFANNSDDEILDIGLKSLSSIFDLQQEVLQSYLTGHHIHNWVKDQYCLGGYSYMSLSSKASKEKFYSPIADTIYFAGEAFTKKSNATVEAAFESSKLIAEKILS